MPPFDVSGRIGDRPPVVFLDYDGTLTPIVDRPEDAVLSDAMRAAVQRLARRCTVAVISGRDRADVERRVGVPGLWYAGSHGFDLTSPAGERAAGPVGEGARAALDRAERALTEQLRGIDGAQIERKRFAIAVHYRRVAERDVERVVEAARRIGAGTAGLRVTGGKKIVELRPDVDWDKGKAVEWVLHHGGFAPGSVCPIYVGDDDTDVDAFRAVDRLGGVSIAVDGGHEAAADYVLSGPGDVRDFLEHLSELLEKQEQVADQ